MKPRTLRSHLTWIIAIIALIPIVLLGSIQVVQIYQLSQEYTRNQLDSMKRMADAVETYVFYHRTAVETIAADIASTPDRDPRRITSLLQSVNGHFAGFTTLYATDSEGRTIAYHSKAQQGLIHADFHDRDYFQQVAATRSPTISPVFLSQEKPAKPLITIAVPILYTSGHFAGSVIGTLDVSQVVKLVTQYDYGPSAYPVVLDNRGKAIYHPDASIRTVIRDLSGEEVVKAARENGQGLGTFYSSIRKQDELVAYHVIPDLNWIVWVSKSTSAVNAAFFKSLESSSLLIVLTLLVTLGIGAFLAKRHAELEQRVDRLKNDLISLASHEFKTPITSIKGSVETLLRRDAQWDEEFKRELLEGVHEDIGRIQELIDEWLDISKIESGVLHVSLEPLRVRPIVEEAWRRLPKAQQEAAIFEADIPPHLPLIHGDKNRLEQVLVNLYTNALRYNQQQPHIRVTATGDERFVHIRVEDNGIGIAGDHLDKIFDRFYRVDVTASRLTGGTGLGLAISKGIMEAHHGRIAVESKEGTGSAFTLSVPLYSLHDGDNDEETQNFDRG
ncbi:sensor histidine kinase [Brevibacillus fluminis]|uniref:histidine kinase n=1 Tax=Brevibacillus fluminis TaxID=511487 RepID=A0A3M8DTB6_9BACL|nr:sensor histidine kinase [Brevibacillus fluminis]RNB91408.1 sensor histidine kinase [Brevibacillus fluminis]